MRQTHKTGKPTVCFITPPSVFLLDERVFVSLGILKVAAVAEQLGYPVEHLDLNGVVNYEDAVLSHCYSTHATVFAITATTPQMVAVTKIKNVLRHAKPDAKLILGGPHPTLVHAAFQTSGNDRAVKAVTQLVNDYDVVVCGDGEIAIELALRDDCAIGLINADDAKSPMFLTNAKLADQPLPARHLVDLESYRYAIDGVAVTAMIGQLGCPFACNFCAGRDSAMLRRVRLRPTNSIIYEMRRLYEDYGIHGFMFFDDELNVNKQFVELLQAMVRLQEELQVEFRCRGFVKAELFTDEQAHWMRTAGFRKVMCGFESGSERILRNINKHATKDDNSRAMEISHKYNLDMKALMSVGHPGESEHTIEDTYKWLLQVQPSDFDVTIITAYPGSPYYDRATRHYKDTWVFETGGDKLFMYDIDYTQTEDFYKGSLEGYKSYVFTRYLSTDDLVTLRDFTERDVRAKLDIPFYKAGAGVRFEASMGQLPGVIYRQGGEGSKGVGA